MTAQEEEATGDCFEVAAAMLLDDPDLVLVHAAVDHPEVGVHVHAWCEVVEVVDLSPLGVEREVTHTICLDYSNGRENEIPQPLYYAIGKAHKVHRYTQYEAAMKMLEHLYLGPWEDDLIEIGR